jgi:hypothetical protein
MEVHQGTRLCTSLYRLIQGTGLLMYPLTGHQEIAVFEIRVCTGSY